MRQPDAAEQAETPIYCLRFVRVGGGGLMRWGWGALGIAPGLPLPRRINTAILDLAPEVRARLVAMSAATIDRTLRDIRQQAGTATRRRSAPFGGDQTQRAGAHV